MSLPDNGTVPYPVDSIFTTVWRANVAGKLETQWYEGIECRQSDLLKTVVHWAFITDRHLEAKNCDEALEYLDKVLGPVHKTDWGCIYSESEKGWFRPECEVVPPPPRNAKEAVENLWNTPGGAFLIIFIVFVCAFLIWWAVGCFRLGEMAWPWNVRRSFRAGRVSYKRQKATNDGEYAIDNGEEQSSDDEDIYLANSAQEE